MIDRVRKTVNVALIGAGMIVFLSALSGAGTGREGRRRVVLEGKAACVEVDMAGGSIVDFHLAGWSLNPLTWNYPEKGDLKARPMGHFLCFDRWGSPSPQELKNGMPFHGEAAQVEWQALSGPVKKNGRVIAGMLCRLPIGGLELKRYLSLSDASPVLIVREEITNTGKLGRPYNIVQHATIGLDFVDESVLLDTNAGKGFCQGGSLPSPEEPVIYWPKIVYKGNLVDLRLLKDDPEPGVTSFAFAEGEEYGWVTAANPGKRLLIGYFWKLSDYPWLNIWRHARQGKPVARGMEFGTTGLHQPFATLFARGRIFDRPLFEYIDAGQTIVKTYTAFLAEIPVDYRGAGSLDLDSEEIVLRELGASGRDIRIKLQKP
jgi:hypothetical protein